MQNVVLHGFDIHFATIAPIFEELEPIFDFGILAKWSGIDTIPQPWSRVQMQPQVKVSAFGETMSVFFEKVLIGSCGPSIGLQHLRKSFLKKVSC